MNALVNDAQALKLLLRDGCSAGASVSLEFVNSIIQHQSAIAFEDFDLCPIILLQPGEDRWKPFLLPSPFGSGLAGPNRWLPWTTLATIPSNSRDWIRYGIPWWISSGQFEPFGDILAGER